MAVTVQERLNSRRLTDGQSHERVYLVYGTADEAAALTALKAEAPSSSNSLTRGDCQVEELFIDSTDADSCVWIGRVPYSSAGGDTRPAVALGGTIIQGTTTGGRQTIKVSATGTAPSTYTTGGATAPDFGGGINVRKGGVDGVEIGVRQFEFTVTKVHQSGSYPTLGSLYALSWTTNSGAITFTDSETGLSIALAAGEGLFQGCDFGRARSDGGLEIVYHFAAAPNLANFAVGDITVTSKKGWQYLWVYFEEAEDGNNYVVPTPLSVNVETVYNSGDWSGLGVGTVS